MLRVGPGRSAAWLARLPWEQEVGRSNRLAPTILAVHRAEGTREHLGGRAPVGDAATDKEQLFVTPARW